MGEKSPVQAAVRGTRSENRVRVGATRYSLNTMTTHFTHMYVATPTTLALSSCAIESADWRINAKRQPGTEALAGGSSR